MLRWYPVRATAGEFLRAWVTAGEEAGLIYEISDAIRRGIQTWKGNLRKRLDGLIEALSVSARIPRHAGFEAMVHRRGAEVIPVRVREFKEVFTTAVDTGIPV